MTPLCGSGVSSMRGGICGFLQREGWDVRGRGRVSGMLGPTYLGSKLGTSPVEVATEEPSPPRRRANAAASGVMYSSS